LFQFLNEFDWLKNLAKIGTERELNKNEQGYFKHLHTNVFYLLYLLKNIWLNYQNNNYIKCFFSRSSYNIV